MNLQQRAQEILGLVQQKALLPRVLPKDASCEDIDVKSGLQCLKPYVEAALQQGRSIPLIQDNYIYI